MNAEQIVRALGGRWNGNSGMAKCPCHEDDKPSLSVTAGRKFPVVVKCHAGCSQEAVITRLKALGLWPTTERDRRQAKINIIAIAEDEPARLHLAEAVLDAAAESKQRPTEYLRARGIRNCPAGAMLLSAVDSRNLLGNPGPLFPAMVFEVTRNNECVGVHVTFLNKAGDGKLATDNPRKMLGPVKGGYIELSEIDPNEPLIVGEGVETVLAAMQISRLQGVSALSASFMPEVELPDSSEVIICADNDEPGVKAAKALAQRLATEGRVVRIAYPPDGLNDWNDALKSDEAIEGLREGIVQAPLWADDGSGYLDQLAKLDKFAYEQQRKDAAKKLGVRTAVLDSEVEKRREDKSVGRFLQPPVLWPDPVDGAEVLDDIHDILHDHVVISKHAKVAVSLWVLHAHAHDAARHSPILALFSPTKRCGKTTALIVLNGLVPKPLPSSNITTATLFRAIDLWKPTLLIDEADAFIREHQDLRGVLDSGHEKTQAYVLRCVGDDLMPTTFSTWAPKVIALIGRMHPTLEDRSIRIEMRRKLAKDYVKRIPKNRQVFVELCQCAARWARDHMQELSDAEPDMPALHDRARDNWEPLIAIADAAGGDWPNLAREAAVALSGVDDDETPSIQLLQDLRALFREEGNVLSSAQIVTALTEMEDRPWPAINKGSPINAHYVARLLKDYKIFPKQVRVRDRYVKGYRADQFEHVFARYLEPEGAKSS
ncbi:DUF3631 domain-containing protein [Mesorhizobium sp.]|uniref:DUF3631 domain-containing protein n=1 Tax=Mesorhizobium sp. TaxID=1871066 RepID=UPI000FE6CF8B|nr:DUF3631 domain-containing protein [Mesorhizobium sp.]RWB60453.1 MAG: DUF3631 domain-containing protein [Mesorhizobium sp.]